MPSGRSSGLAGSGSSCWFWECWPCGPRRTGLSLAARHLPQGRSTHQSRQAPSQPLFGFGGPLGVLSDCHSLLEAQLQLARLTGWWPPMLGCPGPWGPWCLCWFPFRLLPLLRLVGVWEAGLGVEEV